MPGRVGDAPLIGCGTYADDASAGVSATGFGESLMKATIARRVCEGVERGLPIRLAAAEALGYLQKRIDGLGGVIVVDSKGDLCHTFNTPYMAISSIDAHGVHIASISRD
jgi:beta-aspartyl-peptidase (threonine type)